MKSSYSECCVIGIGIVGTLANGVVIIIFLSKARTKKLSTSSEFILNQLSVDLFSCISLILVYGWKIANSTLGKSWNPTVCFLFGPETVLWAGVTSSIVNLIFITLERYLKIVHNPLHQKYYHKWMTHCLVALAWISGSIIFPPNFVSFRSAGGVCIALYSWPNVYDGLAIQRPIVHHTIHSPFVDIYLLLLAHPGDSSKQYQVLRSPSEYSDTFVQGAPPQPGGVGQDNGHHRGDVRPLLVTQRYSLRSNDGHPTRGAPEYRLVRYRTARVHDVLAASVHIRSWS